MIDICECGGVVEGTISHIKRIRKKERQIYVREIFGILNEIFGNLRRRAI